MVSRTRATASLKPRLCSRNAFAATRMVSGDVGVSHAGREYAIAVCATGSASEGALSGGTRRVDPYVRVTSVDPSTTRKLLAGQRSVPSLCHVEYTYSACTVPQR